MAARRFLCDGCRRNTEAHATLCEHCSKDHETVRVYYERLRSIRPEFIGMTLPQVMLQLAKAYIARNT